MKPEELRIGMYYTYPEKWDVAGRVFKLTLDQFRDIQVHKDYEKWVGIPLTEEWLVKFGFKKVDEDWMLLEREGFSISWENECISLCSGVYCSEGSKYDHIKHVHQLQNLYFILTEKELTDNVLIQD